MAEQWLPSPSAGVIFNGPNFLLCVHLLKPPCNCCAAISRHGLAAGTLPCQATRLRITGNPMQAMAQHYYPDCFCLPEQHLAEHLESCSQAVGVGRVRTVMWMSGQLLRQVLLGL